jgi:hypothetical protein
MSGKHIHSIFRNRNTGRLEPSAIHMLLPKAGSSTLVGEDNQAQGHRDTAPESRPSHSELAAVEDAEEDTGGRPSEELIHALLERGASTPSGRKQGKQGRVGRSEMPARRREWARVLLGKQGSGSRAAKQHRRLCS